MKLLNIKPGSADVIVAGIKYGHVERIGHEWFSFDKEGETLGSGRHSRQAAADFILYYYREQARKSA